MSSLLLRGGRVIDPASGLDSVANVRAEGGTVTGISAADMTADEVIDCRGLVVCPGFVDLHVHAHDQFTQRLMVCGGVTTGLELELGSVDVGEFCRRLGGASYLNFGASAGYGYLRTLRQTGIRYSKLAPETTAGEHREVERYAKMQITEEDVSAVHDAVREQIESGGIGIGLGIEYNQGADQAEILSLFYLAADLRVAVFVHTREWPNANRGTPLSAVQEIIANAATTGASSHICHVSSKGLKDTPLILRALRDARGRGVPITAEVPSFAGATGDIGSALFDEGWTERWNADYSDLEWPQTGERLTKERFTELRATQPRALVWKHITPESAVEAALRDPDVLVASDAVPVQPETPGNPRAAGTHARILGHYVRDQGVLGLPEAIAKMTTLPARRIEQICPAMKQKGRIDAGTDADIVVFDPGQVAERATVLRPDQVSAGIRLVLVAGQMVVRDGRLTGNRPGQALYGSAKARD